MLEGVSEVLKHFQASKLASVALLTTTAFLIIAPRYSSFVPSVPEGWQWLVWVVMIFTAVQCVWWTVSASFKVLGRTLRTLYKLCFPLRVEHLSNEERTVLALAAGNAGYFSSNSREQIAVSLAVTNLVEHGLMDQGMMGDAHLTNEGKKFCLAHQLNYRQR